MSAKAVEASNEKLQAVTVPLLSLDDVYSQRDLLIPGDPLTDYKTFLIKIDAEGYDAEVMRGMGRLLGQRAVKFFLFEYIWKWRTEGRGHNTLRSSKCCDVFDCTPYARNLCLMTLTTNSTLKHCTVTNELWTQYGYACFFVDDEFLAPLFGPWWATEDVYEMFYLSNVVCGHRTDPDLVRLLRACTVANVEGVEDLARLAEWVEESLRVGPDVAGVQPRVVVPAAVAAGRTEL